MTIYAWPPVGLKSIPVWHREDPVRRSRSFMTGARYVSAHARPRIEAEFAVSARAYDGAGYMEALKRLIDGGVHFVRLYNRLYTLSPIEGRVEVMRWYDGAADAVTRHGSLVTWRDSGGRPVTWYSGTPANGFPTTDAGFPAVRVTGLPAGALICRPGEFISIGSETRMAIHEVVSAADGSATIRVDSAFTASGPVVIGDVETGIFETVDIPRGGGPINADYTYDWSFRQVFPDEIGTHEEVDPWH